jgi:hypothetical protein
MSKKIGQKSLEKDILKNYLFMPPTQELRSVNLMVKLKKKENLIQT